MKPIPSDVSNEVIVTLHKAKRLLKKAEKLEMTEHDGKKVPAFAADGKGAKDMKTKASMAEKDKYCMKNFGKKYSECSDKEKAQCDKVHGKVEKGEECPECGGRMEKGDCVAAMSKMGGCGGGKMQKAEPGYTTTFNSDPQGVMFMAESGGQTRNAYYTTNQYPYTGKDVANKGATSESFNMESLSGKMNPHEGGGADRQVVEGHLSKAREMLSKARCEKCGGDQYTGCRMGLGPRCPGLANVGEPRRL